MAKKPTAGAKSVVIHFKHRNTTPGAHRYQEVNADGKELKTDIDGIAIGSLYLRKSKFGDEAPAKLEVTITY